MGSKQANEYCSTTACIEIPSTLLAHLITSGALTGNNCKCLDNNARKTLWLSLLHSSMLCVTEQ